MKILLLFVCLVLIVNFCLSAPIDIDCSNGLPNYEANPYDCQKYYGCSDDGVPTEYQCPDDLLWNDKVKACDVKENVVCNSTPTGPTTESQSTPQPSSSTEPLSSTEPPSSTKQPSSTERPISTEPPSSTDSPSSTRPPSSTEPSSSTEPPSTPFETTTFSPTTPKIECSWKTEYFPYPYDCSKYYECKEGILSIKQCEDGKYWNQEIEQCDYIWNVDCTNP